MKIQIKSCFLTQILFELEKENNTIKITLEAGVNAGADLRGADLRGADLGGAYLRRAYLRRADLRRADLGGAYLTGADLGGADLRRAYLTGADLEKVKTPSINDHQFTSEILYRSAKTEAQKDFAARVRLETNQCWSFFFELAKKKKVIIWVKRTLGVWKEYKEKIKEITSP